MAVEVGKEGCKGCESFWRCVSGEIVGVLLESMRTGGELGGVLCVEEVWSPSIDRPDVDELDPMMGLAAERSAFEEVGRRGGAGGIERSFAQEKAVEGGASTLSLRSLCTSDKSSLTSGLGSISFISFVGAEEVAALTDCGASTLSLLFLDKIDASGEIDGGSMRIMVVGDRWHRKVNLDRGGADDSACTPGADTLGARAEKRLSVRL